MKLMPDHLCWKCKDEGGTYLHCFWESSLVSPFLTDVLEVLSAWSGSEAPRAPKVYLMGEWSQMLNVSKWFFSVVMAGFVTASIIKLRHWKTTVRPEIKDWIISMADTTILNNLKGNRNSDGNSLWNTLKSSIMPMWYLILLCFWSFFSGFLTCSRLVSICVFVTILL